MKRMLSFVISCVMVFSLAVPIFAPTIIGAKEEVQEECVSSASLREKSEFVKCRVWQEDENKPIVQNRGGREGWYLDPAVGNVNKYICVDVDDKLMNSISDGENLALVIDYYDKSNGKIALEYPSYTFTNKTVQRGEWNANNLTLNVVEERIDMHSANIWKRATVILQRPFMRNNLDGADFRVGIYSDKMGFLPNGDTLISSIKLVKVNTKSIFDVDVKSQNRGNIFFTGEIPSFDVTIDNSIYPEYARSIGETDIKVELSLIAADGSVYRNLTKELQINPLEKQTVNFKFEDLDTYGLYKALVEVKNEERGLYSSVYKNCSYVRTTNGEIRNPHGGIVIGHWDETTAEEESDIIYKAGFTHVADWVALSQWGRTSYDRVTASEVSPSVSEAATWRSLKKRGFDISTFIAGAKPTEKDTFVMLDPVEPLILGSMPYTEKGMKNLANHYLKAIDIMGDSLDALFVYNEINIAPILNEDRWAATMAEVQRVCYNKIKEVYPEMKVGGPQTNLIGNRYNWLANFLKASGGEYLDFYTFHPYIDAGSPVISDIWKNSKVLGGTLKENVDLLKQYGLEDIPIWATEYGFSTYYYSCESPLQQACWDVQEYIMLMQDDFCDRAYKFQIRDKYYGKSGVSKEYGFGLINSDDLSDDPAYCSAKEALLAYSNLNIQMADAKYVSRVDLDDNRTICYQWKKNDTQQDMLTLLTNMDYARHSFDLGTNEVTVVDIYGNEKKIFSDTGIYTFTFDERPMYVIGNFAKNVIRNDGNVCPEVTELKVSPGSEFKVSITNKTGKNIKVEVKMQCGSPVEVKNVENDIITCVVNGNPITEFEQLGVDIFSGNKLVFSGNVILTYGDVVNMENILAKNQNGAWEIRTTLTNTSNTTKYNGCVRVVGPEKWVGCAEDIWVELQPGETKTVSQILDSSMEEYTGDLVSIGYITNQENLSGTYNATKFDFIYATKAKSKVEIDGDLSEWGEASWIEVNRRDQFESVLGYDTEYYGANDINGKVAVMWDDENFYIAARVYDDVQYCEDTTIDQMWAMDSIQAALIYDPDDELKDSEFEEVTVGLLNGKPEIYRHKTAMSLSDSTKVEGAEVMVKRNNDDKETYYEVKLPWKSVIEDTSKIQAGRNIKFAALINENDGSGRKGYYKIGDGIGGTKTSKEFLKLYLQD